MGSFTDCTEISIPTPSPHYPWRYGGQSAPSSHESLASSRPREARDVPAEDRSPGKKKDQTAGTHPARVHAPTSPPPASPTPRKPTPPRRAETSIPFPTSTEVAVSRGKCSFWTPMSIRGENQPKEKRRRNQTLNRRKLPHASHSTDSAPVRLSSQLPSSLSVLPARPTRTMPPRPILTRGVVGRVTS